jgi:hypothetical protein
VVFGRNAPWIGRAKPVLFALPIIYLLYICLKYAA